MITVVFDLEIQKLIVPGKDKATAEDCDLVAAGKAVHGWSQAHTAGIASAVAYWAEKDRYFVYGDRFDEHLDLASLIESADRVVGYNHWTFDYPLLAASTGRPIDELTDLDAPPGERDIDLLQMIWAGLGRRDFDSLYGLHKVSLGTLGPLGGKNGSGEHAPVLYQEGRFGALLNYNLRDVELTAHLHRFIQRYRYIVTAIGRQIETKYPAAWYV